MNNCNGYVLAVMIGLPLAAVGQFGGGVFSVTDRATLRFPGPEVPPQVRVQGAPFSAVEITETLMVTPDGARLRPEPTFRKLYRDSMGRTRIERTVILPSEGRRTFALTLIEICDPVEGFRYVVDSARNLAHRVKIPPPLTRPDFAGATTPPRRNSVGKVLREDLGRQTVGTEPTEGARLTVRTRRGRDGREVQNITETWTVPDLKIPALLKLNNTDGDEIVIRLENLHRGEPDRRLFDISTYKILDESAPFEIVPEN